MHAQRLQYWSYKLIGLAGLSLAVFALPYCMPGPLLSLYESWPANPQQRLYLIHEYGFDRSLFMQYVIWCQRLITGAWGTARYSNRLVLHEIWYAAGHTLLLVAWTGLLCGLGMALYYVLRRRIPPWSRGFPASTWHAVLGALPGFLVAALLRETLIGQFGWGGLTRLPIFDPYYFLHPFSMLLPATILTLPALRVWHRARSPRLSAARRTLWQDRWQRGVHMCASLDVLFLEVYLMEYVFSFPGLGRLGIEAIKRRDVPLLQGFILCTGLLYFLTHLLCERSRAPGAHPTQAPAVHATAPAPPLPTAYTYSNLWYLCILGGLTICAPWLSGYDPMEMHTRDQFLAPGYRYLCGTDFLGRDLMSRALGGFRSSIPRVVALAALLVGIHWLVFDAAYGFLRHIVQWLWVKVLLLIQTIPHLVLAFMIFLVFERHSWALDITLGLACIAAVPGRLPGQSPFLHRLRQGARLGERLLTLEVIFYFLNLSTESFIPTWGSDLRHGMNHGHITLWIIVMPALAVAWSRYTLSRFGDAGCLASTGVQGEHNATTQSSDTESATQSPYPR